MKKVLIGLLVVVLLAGAYMSFNLESIFADSEPVFIGEGVSNDDILANIDQLDIENAGREDIVNLFGQPVSYSWGGDSFQESDLPNFYIMVYSKDFHIWLVGDKIVELRFYGSFYEANGIRVGSELDQVLEILGQPEQTVEAGPINFEDKVLYKDVEGTEGYCYYERRDQNIRLFFTNYKVGAMYITRPDMTTFLEDYKANSPRPTNQERVNTDDVDLPFVDDPEVLGKWESVDFVKKMEDFEPGSKWWGDDLYLEGLNFLVDGQMDVTFLKWTKGTVMHAGDKTASAYIIKEFDGQKYMFFEWKSGDYVFRNQKPYYYVLKKMN